MEENKQITLTITQTVDNGVVMESNGDMYEIAAMLGIACLKYPELSQILQMTMRSVGDYAYNRF